MKSRDARCPIDWRKHGGRIAVCPACGAPGLKDFVLGARRSWEADGSLDLLSCSHCNSKFFPDFEPPKYEMFGHFEAYLKFYLEIGAGVDQLVRHLFVVPLGRQAQYLEIGCGFGFALDFAHRMFGIEVLGLDPSPFAAAGARILELPIISEYLSPDTDLGDRRFDLIVASEVIEHIQAPVEFLRLIGRQLSADGILILTTPNAASVLPTTPEGVLIPLLSAGWHYILFSEDSLAQVLRSAGFAKVEVIVRDHTIVAAATNGSIPIDLMATVDRNAFRDYLIDRRNSVRNNWLSHGLGYRLFKELTNSGQNGQALEIYEDLRAQISSSYGLDIESPHEQWLFSIANEGFHGFALRYPMCLCGIAYFRGILALNHDSDPARALKLFSLSTIYGDLLRAMLQEVGADDAETEHLVQWSRILRLRALAYTAPKDAAAGVLAILHERRQAPPDRRQHEALLEIFVHLATLGALEAAETLRDVAAAALKDRLAVSDELSIELHRAIGLVELNYFQHTRQAALHFALSERLARRIYVTRPEWAWNYICRNRHDRLLSWVVGGNSVRALLAGRFFSDRLVAHPVPADLANSASRLITQASGEALQ